LVNILGIYGHKNIYDNIFFYLIIYLHICFIAIMCYIYNEHTNTNRPAMNSKCYICLENYSEKKTIIEDKEYDCCHDCAAKIYLSLSKAKAKYQVRQQD
jgi:hypothetical protein